MRKHSIFAANSFDDPRKDPEEPGNIPVHLPLHQPASWNVIILQRTACLSSSEFGNASKLYLTGEFLPILFIKNLHTPQDFYGRLKKGMGADKLVEPRQPKNPKTSIVICRGRKTFGRKDKMDHMSIDSIQWVTL
ncbi:unnamed protein product [Lepeophtheirus salmonis]|uniref:(salmon louse) hypothetical protein n=1 Tax=Lepeophtheirus salmonis TaxID=72036 RepID=A0A7R8CY62_LEPSM|nr:unnamed protein product [Lepeophtheirus salmonis]CAF2967417.1 unnamed protein product [Lepeophtheirus salmonis]